MSRMSRQKGKRGEREAAAALRAIGIEARRGVQYQGGPDSPDVVGIPGVHIESKRTEALNIHAAMEQSEREASTTEIAAVMHKRNRSPWMLTVKVADLRDLWSALDAAWTKKEEEDDGA